MTDTSMTAAAATTPAVETSGTSVADNTAITIRKIEPKPASAESDDDAQLALTIAKALAGSDLGLDEDDSGADIDFADMRTDPEKEINGFDYEFAGNIFKVARVGTIEWNNHMRKALQAASSMLNKARQRKDVAAEKRIYAEVERQMYARHCLKGWKHPVKFAGNYYEYSVENALQLLQVSDFYNLIRMVSQNNANYAYVEDLVKN